MSTRLGLLVVLVLVGCGCEPTVRPGVGDVTLDVGVATTFGSTEVWAEARNGQTMAIQHGDGCNFWDSGMHMYVLDARGQTLLLTDRRVVPLCPDVLVVLEPGGRRYGTAPLDGTLYTESGDPVPMEPGTYTAVVEFRWVSLGDPAEPWRAREARAVFEWPAL